MSLVAYIGVTRLVEMHLEDEKMTPLRFQWDVWTEAPTAFAARNPAEYLESLLRAFRRAFQREGQAHAPLGMKEIGNYADIRWKYCVAF